MRKSILLWLTLAVFCGSGIFHTTQKVHDERQKIAALDADIAREEESLRVLNAEWSYLNQPARLEKLAKTYLHLAPLKGSQFVKAENIPLRGTADDAQVKPVIAEKKVLEKVAAVKKIRHAGLIPASKGASARHIDSHDGQTAVWMPEQVRHGDSGVKAASLGKPAANAHNFADLMKNLRQGIE